jgi:hypothetical protein
MFKGEMGRFEETQVRILYCKRQLNVGFSTMKECELILYKHTS